MNMYKKVINNQNVCIIKETWEDEYGTLQQCVAYANNERDKCMARDMINPNCIKLVRTEYLDKHYEKIDI